MFTSTNTVPSAPTPRALSGGTGHLVGTDLQGTAAASTPSAKNQEAQLTPTGKLSSRSNPSSCIPKVSSQPEGLNWTGAVSQPAGLKSPNISDTGLLKPPRFPSCDTEHGSRLPREQEQRPGQGTRRGCRCTAPAGSRRAPSQPGEDESAPQSTNSTRAARIRH